MPGRSKYHYLKNEVFQMFAKNIIPYDLLKTQKYSDIPKATIYDWHKEFKERGETTDITPTQVMPDYIPGITDITDYEACRLCFRQIIDNEECPPANRIQAGLGMLKLIQMGQELPQKVITGIEEEQEKFSSLDKLSNEERLERIKRRLNGGL